MLKKLLIVFTLILLIANLYVIGNYGIYERRLIRLISACFYLIFFFFTKGAKDILLVYVFLALVATDILGMYYESSEVVVKVIPVLKISAYFLLTVSVLNKLKLVWARKPIVAFFVVTIILNLVWMSQVVWATSDMLNDDFELFLHLLYSVIMVGICAIAVNYYLRDKTKESIYFFCFVFGLVFSDATWYIAYYYNYNLSFYADILFYITALFFIIMYIQEYNNQNAPLLSEL